MADSTAGLVTISPLAGQPVPRAMLVDLARLEREHYARTSDLGDRNSGPEATRPNQAKPRELAREESLLPLRPA